MGNKEEKCIVAGIFCVIVGVIGGGALIACTGRTSIVLGGLALGAGLSGTLNSL